MDGVAVGIGIAEGDVAELDFALHSGLALRFLAVHNACLRVQHLIDAARGNSHARQHDENHHQHQERHDDLHRVLHKDHHVREQPDALHHRGGRRDRNRTDERRTDPVDAQRQAVHRQIHARIHDGHGDIRLLAVAGHFLVCLGEFALLIVFRVVGADDLQARQVLTRDAVQVVRQRLHLLHARHGVEHDEHQQHAHERNHAACQQRPFPALRANFAHGNERHNRRFNQRLHPEGKEHLQLRNVVGCAGNQAGGGETVDFLV